MRNKTHIASNVPASVQVGFCVDFIQGLPCVGIEGFKYYKELEKASKQQSIRFGRCMYFLCALTGDVHLIKFATIYDHELVFAGALNKKLTAEEKIRKEELQQVQKLNETHAKIKEKSIQSRIQNIKENNTLKEKIGAPKTIQEPEISPFIMDSKAPKIIQFEEIGESLLKTDAGRDFLMSLVLDRKKTEAAFKRDSQKRKYAA